jgi:hypothetical protein
MAKKKVETPVIEAEEPIEVHGPWEDIPTPAENEEEEFVTIEDAIDILKSGTDEQILDIKNVLLDFLLDYKDELDFQLLTETEDENAIMPYVNTTPEVMYVSPGVTIVDREETAYRPITIRRPSATPRNGNMIEKLDELREIVNNTAESDIVQFMNQSNWRECPQIDLLDCFKYYFGGKRGDSVTIAQAIEMWVLTNDNITEDEELEILDWAIEKGDKIVCYNW